MPLLHQTDLFRPHNDPDDHWDLACVFAIARLGRTSLPGILIDHPPGAPVLNHKSDPDLGSVAQLGVLSGIWPRVAIGRPEMFGSRQIDPTRPPPGGVQFVLDQLSTTDDKLDITIVGSCRDIAEAIERAPNLFRDKCRAIYLNAGNGEPDPGKVARVEWNVMLDPAAYAKIFSAPCPIYWLPCLEDEDRVATHHSRTYASHFEFKQSDILQQLPRRFRNYFGFMLNKSPSSAWLEALDGPEDASLQSRGGEMRMMYCTASIFHAAGYGVTRSGDVRELSEPRDDWVYRYDPVIIECNPQGQTRWTRATASDRHLLIVTDPAAYPLAMTKAMAWLLVHANFA